MISTGRIPISEKNITVVPLKEDGNVKRFINKKSETADLNIVGFQESDIEQEGIEVFNGFEDLCNTLFVNSNRGKVIK